HKNKTDQPLEKNFIKFTSGGLGWHINYITQIVKIRHPSFQKIFSNEITIIPLKLSHSTPVILNDFYRELEKIKKLDNYINLKG
ncbi:MAG: hypothetical protein V1688_01010, partial [bacterium]